MNTSHPLTFENLNPRQHGRILFAMGMTVSEISKQLEENRATVESWKQRDSWEKADLFDDVMLGLKVRYMTLTFMENKSNANYKEMDFIGSQFERWARIERYRAGGTQTDLNPKLENRNNKPKNANLKIKSLKMIWHCLNKHFKIFYSFTNRNGCKQLMKAIFLFCLNLDKLVRPILLRYGR